MIETQEKKQLELEGEASLPKRANFPKVDFGLLYNVGPF